MNDELKELVEAGESETVEFKPTFNTDVIETAVAFANTRGGRILIGISDEGAPLAQSFGHEALRDYVNRIANGTEPSVCPGAERMLFGEGEVIVLSVPEFPLKPVSTRGRCYRRSGSITRRMTPSEIAELHLHSTGQSMDAMIVPRRTRDDLDFDAVRTYMRRATEQGRRSFAEQEDPWQVLRKLELVQSEQEITRAALLLFGKNPQSPLTQAVVHAGSLRENVHIMDNRIIDGSIIDQVEETVAFIKKNLHVRFEITGEPERKEIWDYPLPAIREAVINAICHRDYGDTADIQIKIFEDALQVWSPGGLPFDITLEDLFDPEHSSKPRNKLVAQVFYDLNLIERYGSGIQRILASCQDAALPIPLFENFSGGFRIKFLLADPVRSDTTTTQKTTQKVLETLREHPTAGRVELAKIIGDITEDGVKYHLTKLKKQGVIRRIGPDKGGSWEISS
jgi:ATP-dependent DNA helicase RecG